MSHLANTLLFENYKKQLADKYGKDYINTMLTEEEFEQLYNLNEERKKGLITVKQFTAINFLR